MNGDTRAYTRLAAYFVLGLSIGSLATALMISAWRDATQQQFESTGQVIPEGPPAAALPRSEPVRLRIPKLDLEAAFETPLGVHEDGSVEVPDSFTDVGWYEHGPTPGEQGPAVVLGHIDSYEGPAVFFHLGQLEPGDAIFVEREDGSTARFIVDALKRYDQDEFPTDAVYGDLAYAGLRLITCSGSYDRGIRRYTHNLVVFAHLAPESEGS